MASRNNSSLIGAAQEAELLHLEHLADLTPDERAAVVGPLDAFTRQQGFVWQPAPLTLVLRTEDRKIVGGLIGQFQWGWLRIEILAVAEEFRGGGWGSKLVAEAERLATEVGCHSSWVDTFSFQAPDFYRRLGYQVFGQLPDYPTGQTRYFLAKRLAMLDSKFNLAQHANFAGQLLVPADEKTGRSLANRPDGAT